MSSWFKPLSSEELRTKDSCLNWLTKKDWFPQDYVVITSENGSMEKRLIKFVVEHINKFVRRGFQATWHIVSHLTITHFGRGGSGLNIAALFCVPLYKPRQVRVTFYNRVINWLTRPSKGPFVAHNTTYAATLITTLAQYAQI